MLFSQSHILALFICLLMKYRADTFDHKSTLSSKCFLHTISHFISLLSFPCFFYLLQYLQFCENGRRGGSARFLAQYVWDESQDCTGREGYQV